MSDVPLLELHNIKTYFYTDEGVARAVDDVSYKIKSGEILGVVGESGCGKSVAALSIMRLIPDPPGKIVEGRILFEGKDILGLPEEKMRKIRGNEISMIFQEPMTSLNPVFTIGRQVAESVILHEGLNRDGAKERAVKVLTQVGIPDARKRLKDYPHQFSGGMRQRVMIAMALICQPKLLIADEPTTALDVTIQAQILELMKELQNQRGGNATILITHDLAVVAETCDRVIVMYGGKIQETASASALFKSPLHPYTKGLMGSIPHDNERGEKLYAIPGNVPSIMDFPAGCRFCTRCEDVLERCRTEEPELLEVDDGREVRCHLYGEAGGQSA